MPTITSAGVIALPDLASALSETDMDIYCSDGTFRSDAKEVEKTVARGVPLFILSSDVAQPGLHPWLNKQAGNGVPVALLRMGGAVVVPGSLSIDLPVTVDELLATLGQPAAGGATGLLVVGADGTVTAPAQQAPAPVAVDDWDDEPVLSQPRVLAPAPWAEASAPIQAAPVAVDSSWDDDELEAAPVIVQPEPVPPAESAPWIQQAPPQPEPAAWLAQQAPPQPESQPQASAPWLAQPATEQSAPASWNQPPPPPPAVEQPATASAPWQQQQPPPTQAPQQWQQQAPPAAPQQWQQAPAPAPAPAHQQAPPAPPMWQQPAPAAADQDVYGGFDMADALAPAVDNMPVARRTGPGFVVVCLAGKGGVGKSLMAKAIAEAASDGGLSVALIDANRGQGDQAKYLRLAPGASLPTIFDFAAGSARIEDVFLTPEIVNASRHPAAMRTAAPVKYSVVLAPPAHLADPDVVTTAKYNQVVAYAKAHFDMVVLDTQIVEATDTSGLIDGMVIPLALAGAWSIGVTDSSRPGLENLKERLAAFVGAGADPSRILIAPNQLNPATKVDFSQMAQSFAGLGTYMGHIVMDPRVENAMNQAASLTALSTLAPMLNLLCFRITGLPAFDPQLTEAAPAKRSLFARLTGR